MARHRNAETDALYATAYEAHPLDEPDDWGESDDEATGPWDSPAFGCDESACVEHRGR